MKKTIKSLFKRIICQNPLLFKLFNLFKSGYKRFKIESLYDYCMKNNLVTKVINNNEIRQFKRPANSVEEFENWNHTGYVDLKLTKEYICELDDAIVCSCNDGIIIDDRWLNDRIDWDRDGIAIYPPNNVLYMDEKYVFQKAKVTKTVDKGIFLLKEFTPNIFHFTLEAISRLKYIDDLSKYDTWPLLLDANGKNDLRTCQLLEKINDKRHPVIWVDRDEVLKVNKLIVPPVLAWGARDFKWRNEKKLGIIVDNSVPEFLRSKVLKDYKPKRIFNKVYVERGNNNRLINEDELKKYLSNHGFEIFNPDKGDFWDEVDCFATANVIVTVVGGALTNVIYSKKDATIIEICPFEYQTVAYTFLIETMGLSNMKMISANVEKAGSSINKTTFSVSEEQFQKILNIANKQNKYNA